MFSIGSLEEYGKMKTAQSTYPLRLPRSVKAEVERRAKKDGISVNQFVATAVAEKLAVMNTGEFFAERRNRANFEAFDRIMQRKGGEKPREGDEISTYPEQQSDKPRIPETNSENVVIYLARGRYAVEQMRAFQAEHPEYQVQGQLVAEVGMKDDILFVQHEGETIGALAVHDVGDGKFLEFGTCLIAQGARGFGLEYMLRSIAITHAFLVDPENFEIAQMFAVVSADALAAVHSLEQAGFVRDDKLFSDVAARDWAAIQKRGGAVYRLSEEAKKNSLSFVADQAPNFRLSNRSDGTVMHVRAQFPWLKEPEVQKVLREAANRPDTVRMGRASRKKSRT
jgi:hypothetical protein